jgi:hypothetical protein
MFDIPESRTPDPSTQDGRRLIRTIPPAAIQFSPEFWRRRLAILFFAFDTSVLTGANLCSKLPATHADVKVACAVRLFET